MQVKLVANIQHNKAYEKWLVEGAATPAFPAFVVSEP